MFTFFLVNGGEKAMFKTKRNRNITGIIVAIIYCIVLYEILIDAPPGEAPNNPFWVYSMIPLGAIAITPLFDYVIKFDFFKRKKKEYSVKSNKTKRQ